MQYGMDLARYVFLCYHIRNNARQYETSFISHDGDDLSQMPQRTGTSPLNMNPENSAVRGLGKAIKRHIEEQSSKLSIAQKGGVELSHSANDLSTKDYEPVVCRFLRYLSKKENNCLLGRFTLD